MNTTTSTVQLGQVLFSMGINELIANNPSFSIFVMTSLNKHKNCDWGDLCAEDIETNNQALINGDRLLSSYLVTDEADVSHEKIWIITEWNRSVTTILFK